METNRPRLILRLTRLRQNEQNDPTPRYRSSLSRTSATQSFVTGTNIPVLLPPPHLINHDMAMAPSQLPFLDITESNDAQTRIKRRKHGPNDDAVVPCQDTLDSLPEVKENNLLQ